MITVRKEETTSGKLSIQYECDCDEFRNNTAATCIHIKELREYEKKMIEEKKEKKC
jgi:hypothetical protein